MRSIKIAAIAIVAALAFATIGASGASAAEFTASKTGALKGAALTSQDFEIASGSGETVICKKLSLEGAVTSLKTETQAVVVKYEECEANTFLGKLSATISPAHYTFNANGSVSVTEAIAINIGGGFATQTVGVQGPLTSISYANASGKVDVGANVTGIHSSGTLGTQTTGTYVGESQVELVGGTISVSGAPTRCEVLAARIKTLERLIKEREERAEKATSEAERLRLIKEREGFEEELTKVREEFTKEKC